MRIQSGPFSFLFDHQEGDSGMGMLMPSHQEHDPTSAKISDGFLYIIRHRSDKLVVTLKAHWNSYVDSMKRSEVVKALSEACVPCEQGADTPLEDTYMPLPKLKRICDELGVAGKLPFLNLPTELSAETEEEWNFLDTFHVGREADLTFYIEILRAFIDANKDLSSDLNAKSRKNLFRIYEEIEKHSWDEDQKEIEDFFDEHKAIYIPARLPRHAVWAGPEECVWKAPEFFDQSFPLAAAEGYQGNVKLYCLFNGILGISDIRYTHYMTQLKAQKDRPGTLATISDIYHHIILDAPDETAWNAISEQFEKYNLVYVPLQNEWHPPSSCLWTDNTRRPGKFAIATQYADLQAFFVGRMGVQRLELRMLIEELIRLAKNDEPPSVSQVKDLIKDINLMGPTEDALSGLRLCNILPVKDMDDRTSLRNTTDIFAIVDRIQYGDLFRGKIPVLDFGFEEVHELRCFLSALFLGNRYMTQMIEEKTKANDSVIDQMLSRHMREKAYAIFRCAVHYGVVRPQDQSLYHRLLASDVHRSSTIIRSITISLCGTQTTVEGAIANLHIEDDISQIRFFVPQDDDHRELCYLFHIPGTLVSHLNISDPGAAKVIGDLVNTTRASVLENLLKEHGIVSVPGIEPLPPAVIEDRSDIERLNLVTPPPTVNYPGPSSSTSGRGSSLSGYRRSLGVSFMHHRESVIDEDSPTPTTYSFARSYGTSRSSVSPGPSREAEETSPEPFTLRDEYLGLLTRVIAAAARASFPHCSSKTPAPVQDTEFNTLLDDVFRRSTDGQMSHDVNIGAAGELYVFEMLLKQNLAGFGRDNWRSTIRNRVCIHEKYRDMDPWRGDETADIVYEDVGPDYKFTKLLESLGYLRAGDSSVTYYLDVKTTKNECGTRLSVSRAQYERMESMTLHTTWPAKEIYIIVWVFNLGKPNMGMRLYLDPVTMEKKGGLIFEPVSYTVAPAEEL